jgi:molybdopterin-containing oxidoreductase family membrane subunit
MNKTLTMLFRSVLDIVERSPGFALWISILCALILLGIYALLASFVFSMEILEFSIKIPWVMMISTYVFLVATGSGLCIINALGGVFGIHRYEMMSKRMAFLSLTTIVFGMLYIVLHLGHPERMPIYNAISPNFRSAISWMGALYSVYLVFVVIELYLLILPELSNKLKHSEGFIKTCLNVITLEKFEKHSITKLLKDPRLPRLVATLAFVTGASALAMLGSVFAHSESRAFWYGAYYPVYFLLSAIFCGYAFLLCTTIITYWSRKEEISPKIKKLIFEMAQVLALLLAVGILFVTFRLSTGLFNTSSLGPVMLLLKGPFSTTFWIFEIGLMSVIPIVVLLRAANKESIRGVLTGSLMVLIGAFVMRYEFVVAGQVYPNIKEKLPSYTPTIIEVFIIIGVLGAFLLVYTLGEKFLPLKEERHQHAQ